MVGKDLQNSSHAACPSCSVHPLSHSVDPCYPSYTDGRIWTRSVPETCGCVTFATNLSQPLVMSATGSFHQRNCQSVPYSGIVASFATFAGHGVPKTGV